jgi:hypothetical protein
MQVISWLKNEKVITFFLTNHLLRVVPCKGQLRRCMVFVRPLVAVCKGQQWTFGGLSRPVSGQMPTLASNSLQAQH